ncbi:MAG: hypothetical protein AAF791_09670 [Bacteroidota bacterium]
MPDSLRRLPDFEADLYLLTTDEGGRRSGISAGYKPTFNFERPDKMHNMGGFAEPDFDGLELGTTVHTGFRLGAPEFNKGRLYVGQTFTIKEGGRIVGRGRITAVIAPSLRLVT